MAGTVTDSQRARERELFLGALEKSDPAEREAFLAAACEDPGARRRIDELLREEAGLGDFLETPALASPGEPRLGPGGTEVVVAVTEKPGDRIGRYKLLQKIGEGGCGVVYMAEQEEPVRRRVALKVIKLGMDTRSVIARFEAERQALALMDHPNIARVLDAGATETGRPYFVMELVRGIKITEYCDQNGLPPQERLKLFIQVCHAIQHAHQKGIIHRDIKPSNILVTLHDGVPVPKVIDFGIAKATEQRLTDKTLFTEFAAFIGTPAYMSPEQAEMSGLDVDTRSDIYALGVLLYELLTGKTPFDAETLLSGGLDECRRMIREKEPARPSTRVATMLDAELTTTAHQRRTDAVKLIHLLRGDLDWVVMKCLEKDRARRYASASDVAGDVQRYLDGEPVLARPPSNIYRLQKLFRRHRGAFAAAAAIAFLLVSGIAVSTWLAVRATSAERNAQAARRQEAQLREQAEQERIRAEQEESSARLNEYVADINLAQQSLAAGNIGRAVQLLDKHQPRASETDLRGFEWRYLWQLCQGDEHISLPTQDGAVQSLAVSGNGLLAVGLPDKVNVWSLRTRSLVKSLPKSAFSLAFLPDGQSLVAASPTTLRIWHLPDWREQVLVTEGTGRFGRGPPRPGESSRLTAVLSADGARLAASTRDGVRIWDTSTWQPVAQIAGAFAPLAFAPDGRTLAADSKAGIGLWREGESQDGTVTPHVVLQESTNLFVRGWSRADSLLAFAPDGKSVVAARNILSPAGVFVLSVWNTQTGEHVGVMPENVEHTGFISSLAFSPDGRTLATASRDYSIRLWDFARRERIATLHGHLQEVWAIAFSTDGKSLISGAKDGSVKLWQMPRRQKDDTLAGAWQPLAFSRDGETLAAIHGQSSVAFLNVRTGETNQLIELARGRNRFGPFGPAVALSDDFRTVVQPIEDGVLRVLDIETGQTNLLRAGRAESFTLSPDGRVLVTASGGRDSVARWWDLQEGVNTIFATNAQRIMFSPDGAAVAVFQRDDIIQIWDVPSRSLRATITDASVGFFPAAAAFSHDGALLATTGGRDDIDNAIHLWDTRTGKSAGACLGHKQPVLSIAFSPDGRTLASSSDDSTLKLWNITTKQELLTIRRLGTPAAGLLFSPTGQMLVSGASFRSPNAGLYFYRASPPANSDIALSPQN